MMVLHKNERFFFENLSELDSIQGGLRQTRDKTLKQEDLVETRVLHKELEFKPGAWKRSPCVWVQ